MVIVFNPVAGRRRAHLLWRVLDVLLASGMRLQVAETRHAGHATVLAREAARAGEPLVVAAGGDGTIAEVAAGLVGADALLGVIPLGTANVLAREYGLPFAPQAIAAALAFRRTRPLWPGVANGAEGGERMFVQMLGVGFDAQVVHRLNLALKRRIGRVAYVTQSLHEMVRYGFPPVRLRIDGREEEAASVIISKGRLYGGPYLLAPEAAPDRPGFQVATFARGGRCGTALYGAALPLGWLPRAPGLTLRAAHTVEIVGNARVPAQADGDAAGFAPLLVRDAAAPLRLVTG